MEKLSVEEKAKAYDEAKARMSRAYNDNRCTIGFMNEIFPETKESEDEKIRKRIIHALHGDVLDIEETNKAIAWLEKQGNKDEEILVLKDQIESLRAAINLEKEGKQKPADKVEPKKYEPKFKIGDIVKDPYGDLYHIAEITDNSYKTNDGRFILFMNEDVYRLWTIQDAKPGDILVSKDGCDILIFRNLDCDRSFSSYYNIQKETETNWSNINFIPATKEQCDLLFQKMKEAGYEWDANKKELKEMQNDNEI